MQPLFDDIGSMTNPTHVALGYSENIVHELLAVKNGLGVAHTFTQGELLALDVASGEYYPITLTEVLSSVKEVLASGDGNELGGYATLETGVEGSNNALTFTAIKAGACAVKVQLLDPSGNSQDLGVSISGDTIVVSLATSSEGAITSTAAEVKAAVNAHLEANKLVVCSDTGDSTGVGTVAAVAATVLSGAGDAVSVVLANRTATKQVIPGSVTVYATIGAEGKTGTDDGNGSITGDITGSIDYESGLVTLDAFTPDNATDVEAIYKTSEKPRAIVKEGEEVEVANGETDTVNGYVGGLFDLTQLFVGSTDNMYDDLDDEVKSFYRDELMKYNIRITDVLLSEPE